MSSAASANALASADRRSLGGCAWLGLLAVGLIGCSVAAPVPTPTPVPAPEPTAQAQTSVGPGGADPSDVQNAFLSNVDDLIAEANDLTASPCADLTQVTRDNPNLLSTLRGFAAAMKRVAGSQAMLDTDSVKTALGDLDHTMGELDSALSQCGIAQR